ncbi:hypothetical protein L917_02993, partial [Phytophthora nicotianae]
SAQLSLFTGHCLLATDKTGAGREVNEEQRREENAKQELTRGLVPVARTQEQHNKEEDGSEKHESGPTSGPSSAESSSSTEGAADSEIDKSSEATTTTPARG